MARTKQTSRKTAGRKSIAKRSALASKTPATKSPASKRNGYVVSSKIQMDYDRSSEYSDTEVYRPGQAEPEDTNPETQTTPNSPSSAVVQSPRAVRGSYDQAPNLGNYAIIIQAGALHDSITACIHVDKFPERTLAVFERIFGQQSHAHPFRLYTLNVVSEIFTIYHHFLDTGVLFSHHADLDQDYVDNGQAETHEDAEWSRLAQSYLLGLRLEDEKLCNAVVDVLIEKMSEVDRYPTGIATEVYSMTALGDPLRSLIVDLHVCKGLGTWISPPHEDAFGPEDFLQDVQDGMAAAAALMEEDDVPMPWEFDVCQYHKHDFTAKCERKTESAAITGALAPVVRGRGKQHACPDAEQYGCSETFATKQSATRHSLSVHHANLTQRHACPDAEQYGCSNTYNFKQDATRHSRIAHHGEAPRVQRRKYKPRQSG